MKEEILTAKEWLEKKLNKEEYLYCHNQTIVSKEGCNNFMERYANYKSKILVEKYDEYIKLLSDELNTFASLQISHPHLVKVYKEDSEIVIKGNKLRQEICNLKQTINEL